jgi:hypothetical protein
MILNERNIAAVEKIGETSCQSQIFLHKPSQPREANQERKLTSV